jgi:hypothetical protein
MRQRVRGVRPFLLGVIALAVMGLPSPAYAWWGWLEKLSGPSGINGPQFDFRVVCFGEKIEAQVLTQEAEALMAAAMQDMERNSARWKAAADKWQEADEAWADALGDSPPDAIKIDERSRAERLQAAVLEKQERGRAMLMATSSAGVVWSFCNPTKARRMALDVNYGVWRNDGSADYAGGARINLTTLTTSVSYRLLAHTRWDFIEVSAGGGAYWFSSAGFPSNSGVVLEPGRLTLRAPSSWSSRPKKDWRRWAAVPVYAIGLTVFPAGFEATDFAGVGDKAVRIPRELLTSHYFYLNIEPFLHWPRK